MKIICNPPYGAFKGVFGLKLAGFIKIMKKGVILGINDGT